MRADSIPLTTGRGTSPAAPTTTRVAVLAEPPLPGRCLPGLLAAHEPEWVAGLCAAMLRDTLDGLQSVDASEYLVFASGDDEALRVLARHVPAPWRLVGGVADASAAFAKLGRSSGATDEATGAPDGVTLLARGDAPSAPIEPLVALLSTTGGAAIRAPLAILGRSEDGRAWLLGARAVGDLTADLPWDSPELAAAVCVRCARADVPVVELPRSAIVDAPSAVLALLEELRRHPERAPRTAQFIVTRG
ncbi:MAG: hypothetical protein KF782_19605 [Labilithrix sp.]|nr:hypothetical protein [Labilithrix sp.]